MKAEIVQKRIDNLNYWDARVLKLSAEYFCDEVTLEFEDTDKNKQLHFRGCSRFNVLTDIEDRLIPIKQLTKAQIPYFLQNIEFVNAFDHGHELISCKILMPPLNLEILCTSISIE